MQPQRQYCRGVSLTRRSFLLATATALALPVAEAQPAVAFTPRPDGLSISPTQALAYLNKGNARWANGRTEHRSYAPAVPATRGQWPFAGVLSCSDSRVPPDTVFDLAPSNLFVVRNAGNVVDDEGIGSLEYAAEHLGISLILVLGHSRCGAVMATEESLHTGTLPGGYIDAIVEHIAPAITALPADHSLPQAVAANARHSAALLASRSDVIQQAVVAGDLSIACGVYSLANRRVSVI